MAPPFSSRPMPPKNVSPDSLPFFSLHPAAYSCYTRCPSRSSGWMPQLVSIILHASTDGCPRGQFAADFFDFRILTGPLKSGPWLFARSGTSLFSQAINDSTFGGIVDEVFLYLPTLNAYSFLIRMRWVFGPFWASSTGLSPG